MTERDIFLEALEITTPEARAAYLEDACREDVALRRKVDELLKEHFSNDSLLAGPALDEFRAVELPVPESPTQMLGRYKLLEKIGEGGFGEVWMAEQREPIKRPVAVKIIKPGMDSRQIVARFEAERQALAMMDHANIAKIFDAGTTETGRPYFVMELVRGIKITEYCDQNQLPTPERLKLFILVCQAIQHAHQKGIIHRDIKPSNILVTLHDGVPVPKVIDFGIAKATQQELTDKTVFTQFQQFIGTPAYISPEQAEMSGLDIDTRADIYSLGVLLYELLVGQTPFDAKEMMRGGLDALRQLIREKEPLRPSTKLNTLVGEARTTVGKRRQTEVGKLMHQLQGDLDWIVMKCLEKDRTRRYETANGLAADIERHLKCEPVVARPPSRFYEFQKTVRRHKVGFAAATAVMLALAIGLSISTWTLIKEKKARERTEVAERDAQSSANRAEQEAQRAEKNAKEANVQRKQAEALAEDNRRNLYAARIKLAAQAIAEGDVPHAQELLEGLRPQAGQEDLRSFDWYYLHQLARSEKQSFTKLGGRARCVAFSPNGQLLAAACEDRAVRLWDSETQVPQAQLNGHTLEVTGVAFAPDGKTLASASADGTVRLWDVTAERELQCLSSGTNPLTKVAFSPDGNLLAVSEGARTDHWGNPFTRYAVCSKQGRILLWNMKTHEIERILDTGNHDALSLAFSFDGSQLAAGGVHNTLTVFDVATGKQLVVKTNLAGPVFATLFLSRQRLAAASWNPYQDSGRITVFNPATLEQDQVMLAAGKVTCLALSPDGRTLATAGPDRVLRFRDVETGHETGVFHGHKAEIWSVAFSADGKTVATGGFDDAVRLWDRTSHPARQSIAARQVFSVAFSPDGSLLACSGQKVEIYDTATGGLRRTLADYEGGDVRVAFSPDGSMLAATDLSEAVHFWDTRTWDHWMSRKEDMGTPAPRSSPGFAPDSQFAFSPDSTVVARAGSDGFVRFWNARSGTLTGTIDQRAQSVCYIPDGTALITVGPGELCLWSTLTQRVESRREQSGGLLRISDDGRHVAAGNASQVSIRNLPGLSVLRTMHVHREPLYCVRFSHDGKILATASWDGTVKLWQVATGQELFTIPSHLGVVWSVAFSPDDRTLAFGAGTGSMGTSGELTILRCASAEKVSKRRQESLPKTSDQLGRSAKWKEAAAAFAELIKLGPTDHWHYHSLAPLLVAVSDTLGYRQACREMQTRFQGAQDEFVAERMAKACLLLPSSGVDPDTISGWIKTALSAPGDPAASPWNQSIKSLAEYRQGNFTNAVQWAERLLARKSPPHALNAQAWMVLAMAHWHLKDQAAARRALAGGHAVIEKELPRIESGDLGWDWVHWIAARALHREAGLLINGKAPLDPFKTSRETHVEAPEP